MKFSAPEASPRASSWKIDSSGRGSRFLSWETRPVETLVSDHDVDIFVRFDLEYAVEEELISDFLEEALKIFNPERIHGSRDYFQFPYKGLDFEIVPVLAVEDASQALNVTDMSPLHVEYFVGKS